MPTDSYAHKKRIVRILADNSDFWFPICALAMRKTDFVTIFLMHFTLTFYRDFHVMSDKSSGRWTAHKSRWWTGGILIRGIRFVAFPASEIRRAPKRTYSVRIYEDIIVCADDPHSRPRTCAPNDRTPHLLSITCRIMSDRFRILIW